MGETVTVCHEEVVASPAFINSLTPAQRLLDQVERVDEGGGFLRQCGADVRGPARKQATTVQKKSLLGIVEVFVGRAEADVARARMAEVCRHLDDTYVTWAGGIADDSAFYVRVHSPVVWVEVDCQGPGPLAGAYSATQSLDAALSQQATVLVEVVAAVGKQPLRLAPWPASHSSNAGDSVE
nr:DUF3500 domain-containing protein [Streptomyces sp. DH-12]